MPTARRGSGWGAVLAIGLALGCAAGPAPAGVAAGKHLHFEHLGVEQGLPQESVTAIVQDRRGFLWFGSQSGLGRYDGYRVLAFRREPDQAGSLADNYVTALHQDDAGHLWVGTRGGGLMRYDATLQTFERIQPPVAQQRGNGHLHVRAIIGEPAARKGGAGALWIATGDGLHRLEPDSGRFESWHHDPANPESLVDDDVLALARDGGGRLWVGTSGGLDRFTRDSGRFEHFRVDSDAEPDRRRNTVQALRFDARGSLWVGSSSGLEAWRVDGPVPQRRRLADDRGPITDPVRSILEDRHGGLWFGTAAGLLHWQADLGRLLRYRHDLRDPASLADNDIDSLYQDRGGTLWVGTHTGGASRVDLTSGGFERIAGLAQDEDARDANKVYAVAGTDGGPLWLGTLGGGLLRVDRASGEVRAFRNDPADPNSLPNDYVRSVHVDGDGTVWAGTDAGLARLDAATGRFRTRHFGESGPASDAIRQIEADRAGGLWLGTEGGVHRYDPGTDTVRSFRHDPADAGSLSQGRVLTLWVDVRGVLWVGTDSGLDRLDTGAGHFRHFRHDPGDPGSLSHSRVHDLFESAAGQLWVGTAGGLNRLDASADGTIRFRRYTYEEGLAADAIGAILADAGGRLWISTNAGISRFEPATGRFRNYSARDGLLDGSYYIGSGHAAGDGTLYFGGLAGLSAFRPDLIRDNSIPPAVAITELQIFNRPVRGAERPNGVRFEGAIEAAPSLRLSHANSVFSLEFAALHFADPRRNRYAYQLVGFDPGWIETDSSRRFVTYTNLAPGDYTFRVKAANKDGVWSTTGAALDIHVEPPYWATWWFRTLLATFLLGSVWAVIRYRVRGLNQQRAALAEQVRERTAEVVQQKEAIEQAHSTLSVLGEIGREITASLDETAIFRTLDRHVHGLLDATTFGIYLLDADGKGLTSAWRVEGGETLPLRRVALDTPGANIARSARERAELLIEHPAEDARRISLPGTVPTLSALFAPLVVGERLLGAMTIQSPQAQAYGEREKVIFRSLCAYGAIALDNALAYRRLAEADAEVQRVLGEQKRWLEQEVSARTAEVRKQKEDIELANSTLSVLGEVGREITAMLDEAEVCRTLERHVHGLLDATTFAIYLLDADGRELNSALRVEDRKPLPPARIALDNPTRHAARCARERQELFLETMPGEADPSHVPGTLDTLSALFAPLMIGERVLGVMTIQSPREHAYSERERLVFRTLCAYGAIALDNAAAYRRLGESDAEIQRVLREQQLWLEQEVSARTVEVVQQKEDIEQAHRNLAVLGEIGREITATLDEAAIFRTLDSHVHAMLDAATFAIYRMDGDGRGLTSAHLVEEGLQGAVDHIELDSTSRIGARCVRERRELYVERDPSAFDPSHVPGTLRTLSSLFAPLMIGNRVIGMMTIQSPRQHAYGEREQLVFRTLCAYGAIALDNAAAYRRLAEADADVQRMLREQQVIFDNVAAAVFFVKDRVIHRCNRGMEEMLGYGPGELVGKPTQVYHPSLESWEALGQKVYPTIHAGEVSEGEWQIMRKDGSLIWISFRGRALDPADESQGTIWVAHDISERKRTEAELERIRREQQLILDNSPGGGILLTRDRIIISCNAGLEKLLAYEPGTLAGQPARVNFASDEAYEAFGRWAYPILASGGTAKGEVEYCDRHGEPILAYVSGKAIDPADLSKGVVWMATDLRQQKKDAAELDRARRELQIIFDNNIGAIAIVRDRHIERCSRGFLTMYGYTEEEALGRHVDDFSVSPESSRELGDATEPDLRAGRVVSGEYPYRRKDGSSGWLVYQGRALDPEDLDKGTIWLCQDISERKRAEAALQWALQEQKAIFDNITGAMWIAKDGVIERCNRGFEEMLGLRQGEGAGKPLRIGFVSEDAWSAFVKYTAPIITAGGVAAGEEPYLHRSGERRWMLYQGKAIDPANIALGTIWFSQDITERKRSETALLEAKANLERGLAEVEQLNHKVSLLGELTGFLQACPSATEAFSCIGDFGPRLFPGSVGALYLAEESGDLWVEQGRWGSERYAQAELTPSFPGGDCWALRRSRAYRVDAPAGALCCPHVAGRDSHAKPYACLPLTAQGKTFGLLHVEHHEAQGGVEADRRHGLAVAMAEQIALAIANVQLREALLQQSIRDPLTGLYNRRYLQEALFREMAHSKRNQSKLAVMMIDVDHFKKFNDTFGHHAGDVVLQSVARVIEARFRRSDIACRFGGEEFTVLLPGTDVELALRLANGVLEGIRDLVLSHENRPLDRVTASLGVAIFPEHGNTPQALIEAADAALYQAKTAGRNRVVVSGT